MADRAREEVTQRYHIKNRVDSWIDAFEQVTLL